MLNIFKHKSADSILKKVQRAKPTELKITFDNGNVFVNGPISDKLFCYGLLTVAHDIIKDYKPEVKLEDKPEEKKIIPIGDEKKIIV